MTQSGLYNDGYCWVYRFPDKKEAAGKSKREAIHAARRVKKDQMAYMAPRTILQRSQKAGV